MFHFADLVKKYAVACEIVALRGGGYEGGEYVRGEPERRAVNAAIVPLSQGKVYQSGGALTTSDRDFYIRKADDSIDLDDTACTYYVAHKGKTYKVEGAELFAEDYADVNRYTLKRVDSFDA